MQLRRVLLLFALVLGLSALVAALAPPPSERKDEEKDRAPVVESVEESGPGRLAAQEVRFTEPRRRRRIPLEHVAADTRVTVVVEVSQPGDVELAGLGLRQTADSLAPARFDLLARPEGRYGVRFLPLRGAPELLGRLVFGGTATIRPRPREG